MASPPVDLRHPVPDLQSLQGAYVGNIERLEEHAERMSEAGSDLQEEIRKTYSELKLCDSRRSSLRSTQAIDEPTRQFTTRSRNVSTSSHANSIVDLNGNARWGGYSPGGYVTSPVGSLRSGTGSNQPASVQRHRSGSKASRLGQVVHPEEVEDEGNDDAPPPEQRKVSSFTRIYDEVANGLPEDLRNSIMLGTPHTFAGHHGPYETHNEDADHRDLPDRPPTAASTDTTHQARTLWMDFDGVHCPDTVEEEPEPCHSSHTHSRQSSHSLSSMIRSHPDLPSTDEPPPEEGMVFYPAPVPRMLNLPKRLSQLPATNVQARRRTQLLESMQTEHRKSMPLLGETMADPLKASKKNRQSLMALPPQLRASAYFDNRVAPTQEFAVKGESAEATLESILDASAHAPVSAFTDHPFAGTVGDEVYGAEHKRRSSKLPEVPPTLQETRRRSSFNLLDTKRNSSGEALKKLKKRNSSADMNLLLVRASESRMSLGDQLEDRDEEARGPQAGHEPQPARRSFEDEHDRNPDHVYEEEEASYHDEEEQEPQYGAPTTLLAELQLRKAKQKSRNLNYATLMEQGLVNGRQTLLQMNDVAEAEKQRRIRKKVNLAWEAPEDDSDDDVPLGVLYRQAAPQQNQHRHQSMGLLEQRELEDSEPLSSRRNRLRGVDPNQRRTQHLGASSSQLNLAMPAITTPDPESDEEEGETLAGRMRRLKEKQQRETALGDDVRKSTVSGDFAAEMMLKFGAPSDQSKPNDNSLPGPSPGAHDDDDEEETLGQRRARLQAEGAAAATATATATAQPPRRPALGSRGSTSLADLLAANPLDAHANQGRKISNEMLVSQLPRGSLLHKNVVEEQKRKQQRLTATMRASSYGTVDPLLRSNGDGDDDDVPLGMKFQTFRHTQNPMTMGMGMGMNGMPMMSQPHLNINMNAPMMMQGGAHQAGFMRQTPMMGMPLGMNGIPMQMGMNGMGMGMNGMMPMGMNGMSMGMMPIPTPMDPRQRDQIDRWMQGIGH
ncbi:hypothetical protein BDW02DRAFT_369852 [Decorospora gaudefroyi]|uniref:Uncharacterized protein n=1 Tax=Decorospora gaudefroyi TaxID=184978 RepID=A0A6A5KEY1_9PLEO|nr:hypothetical protein BDW02DRAFT_369852 [Decorospora gaudefroyi]